MNTETLEKMRKMKLLGMFRAFKTSIESGKTENCTSDEMISNLIQSEWDDRKNRGIERHLKNARFRYKASLEELNFQTERNIDRNQLMRFAECTFINKNENILITRRKVKMSKSTLQRYAKNSPLKSSFLTDKTVLTTNLSASRLIFQ